MFFKGVHVRMTKEEPFNMLQHGSCKEPAEGRDKPLLHKWDKP